MKTKIALIVLFALIVPSLAFAQGNSGRNATTGSATSSANQNRNATSTGRGAEMRSDVAEAVQNILRVGNRNGGLGEQVRVIARELASSTEKVKAAKDLVEGRSGLKTFLIGTDYKNLGFIRSEIVKTQSRLNQLRSESGRFIEWEQNEIEAEISKIETERAELMDFIEEHEDKFSLFGWVARLFQ